jgi:hypothetical protein
VHAMIIEIVAEGNGVMLQDRSCLAAVTGVVTATVGPGREGGGTTTGRTVTAPVTAPCDCPLAARPLAGPGEKEDTSMAADSSTAEALGFSRSGRRRFRFPCGHIEPDVALGDRLRRTAGAVWVGCRACNVIALVVPEDRGALTARGHCTRSNRV